MRFWAMCLVCVVCAYTSSGWAQKSRVQRVALISTTVADKFAVFCFERTGEQSLVAFEGDATDLGNCKFIGLRERDDDVRGGGKQHSPTVLLQLDRLAGGVLGFGTVECNRSLSLPRFQSVTYNSSSASEPSWTLSYPNYGSGQVVIQVDFKAMVKRYGVPADCEVLEKTMGPDIHKVRFPQKCLVLSNPKGASIYDEKGNRLQIKNLEPAPEKQNLTDGEVTQNVAQGESRTFTARLQGFKPKLFKFSLGQDTIQLELEKLDSNRDR